VTTITVPEDSVVGTSYHSTYNIFNCDNDIGNPFMGVTVPVDWNLDFFPLTTFFDVICNPTTPPEE